MAKKAERKLQKKTWKDFFSRWKFHFAVFIFSFLIYANTIPNDYNLDDELVTTVNASKPHQLVSKGIKAIPDIFTSTYYSDAQGYAYEYRPVVLASFAIEHSIFGDNPHTGHLINVAFYSLLCLLLLFVLNLLFKDYNPLFAVIVTLLFAAFPMHTEVVASLKNRDEILALGGGLAAAYCMILFADRKRWYWLLAGTLFFAAGMLSKLSVISFAVIIPMLVILFRNTTYKQAAVMSAALALVIFPLVPRGLLWEHAAITVSAFLVAMLFQELRNRALINLLLLRLKSLLKSFKEPQKAAPHDSADFSLVSKKTFIAVVSLLIFTTALFLLLGINNYTYPLILLIPFLTFPPVKGKRWLRLTGAIIAIYISNLTRQDIMFEFFFLLYAYSLMMHNRFGLFELVSSATVVIVAYHLFESNLPGSLLVLGGAAATIRFPNFKKIIRVGILLFRLAATTGYFIDHGSNTFQELFKDFFIPYFLIEILVFWFPQRRYIIICGISASLLFFAIHYRLYPSHQAVQLKAGVDKVIRNIPYYGFSNPIPLSAEKPVSRPIDFAESVTAPGSTFNEKAGTGMMILLKYARLTVIPYPMSFYYGYKYIEKSKITRLAPLVILGAIIILTTLALTGINRYPLLSSGFLLYLFSIAPFTGVFIPVSGMVADRFLFIPSIGFCTLLTWVAFRLARTPIEKTSEHARPVLYYFFAALSLLYSGITIARNTHWKDSLTLMRHDVRHLPESVQAHNLLATHLARRALTVNIATEKQDLLQEAESNFEKAVSIYPDFFNAWYDLGRVRLMMGKFQEAEEPMLKVIGMDSTFSEPFFQLGLINENKGDYPNAVKYYGKYLERNPGDMDALTSMGFCYARMQNISQAISYLKASAALYPQRAEPLINISRVFANISMADSAVFYLEHAEMLEPRHPDIPGLKTTYSKSGFYNSRIP